ncbi:MAG: secretin and TonB N-terminal domain-containing protein [Verrucomicrobia bacterium]|nr:secretin and TonB N-terminal domain-containing protein [Verrucomicrobiota bacterium]
MRPSRLLLLACAFLAACAAFAAEAVRTFDVPAGDAADTLRRFAQQAGREIVYPAQDVRGRATNAVRGELPVADALRQLLAGTQLVATTDVKSGAISVSVAAESPKAPAAPRVEPAIARPAAKVSDSDLVTLSPFVVATEKDEGFVAAASLAGGRLSTSLKDTPVAYSVLTRDFLDVLALNDTEQAMTWSVGSYMPIVALSAYRYNDNEGGSSIMSRGLQTNATQRNFFLLGLNADTYSQERIDYARGPNALLIGTSGLGGVVNGLTKRARTDKAFDRLGVQFGSWNKFRTTLDFNHPINDKLAVRANLLWQDADTWRDLEFDRRKGAHVTATFKPFRRTQIRAEYEHYLQSTIMGRETMSESISGWDGTTTVPLATDTIASSDAKGISRLGSSTSPQPRYIPGLDPGVVMNWANTWNTMGGAANAAVPVGGKLALSTANLNVNGGAMIDSYYGADTLFRLAESGSLFRRPTRETVIQPKVPTLEYGFHETALFAEHQQGEHLFFEAAGTLARTDKHVETAASRMGNAVIDINATLPTGAPNPNFKQVYSEALASTFYYHYKIREGRVATALVFDDTKFGSFRANLIAGARLVRMDLNADTSVMNRNPDIRRRSVDDNFTYRFYWNNPTQPLTYPSSVSYVDPIARTSTTYSVSKVTDLRSIGTLRASDTAFRYAQAALNTKFFNNRLNLIGGARRDSVVALNYSGNNTNNTLADYPANWDGHTIYYRPIGPADYFKLTYQAKDAAGNITGNGARLDAAARPRDASFRPLPQYANDRFRDDYSAPEVNVRATTLSYGGVFHLTRWASVYANYAESFRPPGAGITITGQALPVSTGEGWDAGLRLTLLDGRINASFGKYSGKQIDAAFDNTGNTRKYANIVDANRVGDQNPNGLNNRGLTQLSTVTFDFSDTQNRGYEIDIVANVTKNWRLTANAGIPTNQSVNPRKDEFAYLAANEATLRQIVLDAGVVIDGSNAATVDLNVPVANRSPDAASAAAWNNIVAFKATTDPRAITTSDQPKFTSNLYTDYRFTTTALKGLRIGAGVQYIGRTAIGNRGADTIISPTNSTLAVDNPNVDANTRIYRDAFYTATATLGYQYRLGSNRTIDLSFRVGNLLGNDDLIYIGAGLRAPNGDITRPDRITVPTTFVYRQPRSYTLSATVGF